MGIGNAYVEILQERSIVLLFTMYTAIYCSASRVFLVLLDRATFKNTNHFYLQILLNSLYPLLLSLSCSAYFSSYSLLASFLFSPNVILHALLSFLAAWSVSLGLKRMEVRYVVVVSKVSDIIIPVASFIVYSRILPGWELAGLTLVAYIPIILSGFSTRSIDLKVSALIVGTIVIQSLVNSFLKIDYKPSLEYFSAYITCILFWRFLFCITMTLNRVEDISLASIVANKRLVLRSFVALSSQGAFFLALLDETNNYVWPIFNTTPLISMIASRYFLREKGTRSESYSLVILGMVISIFFLRVVL